MIPTFMQRGLYDDPAEQTRSKCSPHYVCPAAAAVSETRRSVPDNSQHPDERSKLPIARHLHHPSLSDESMPAAANGESHLKRWSNREQDKAERLTYLYQLFFQQDICIRSVRRMGEERS